MKRILISMLVTIMFFSTLSPVNNALASEQEVKTVTISQELQQVEELQDNIQPLALPLIPIAGVIIGYAVRNGIKKAVTKYGKSSVDDALSHSYATFPTLKKHIGLIGPDKHWHHIVEQSQITRSGISKYTINSAKNVIDLDADVHEKVTSFYNSAQPGYAPYKTVRHWMDGKSYEEQYAEGIKIMQKLDIDVKGLYSE